MKPRPEVHALRQMLAVALATFVASASAAWADGFTPRAILSYQTFDTGLLSTAGFRQTYDLRLEESISSPMSYRLSLRGEDFNGRTEAGTTSSHSGFRQLQPGAQFLYTLPTLQIQTNYDGTLVSSDSGSAGSSRDLRRVTGNLSWHPIGLPGVTLQGLQTRSRDDATALDINDRFGSATLDYQWRGLRAAATERVSQLDDGRFDFARKSIDHQGMIGYDASFFHGRVSTMLNGIATFSNLEERATANGTVLVPSPDQISRALYAIDDTPLDDRDKPLMPLAALIDGDVRTSTGINIGPDGLSYHNIALDFGRFADVDEIRIMVRNASGDPVRTGGALRWDAFTSEDGILWTPMQGGASTQFDVALSLYDISFRKTTTRYVKLVSFGVNAEETFVTEVEAFYHTEISSNEVRKTDMRLYSGTASMTARPTKWSTLSYTGLYNSALQRPSDRPEFSTNDMDHVGSLLIDATRWLSFGAQYQTRSVDQTGGLTQTFDGWTGLVKLAPTQQLTFTLESQHQNEDTLGRLTTTDGLILHTYARVLPSLDMTLDVGEQHQDLVGDGNAANRKFVTGTTSAQLLPGLRLLLNASLQRTHYEGDTPVVNGLFPERDDRWTADLYWRPGRPFAIGGRFGWVSGEKASGFTQRYRVEWYPFAEGTVSIGGTYDQDIDPYSNRKSSRFIFSPRWMINRHAIFDVNYTVVKTTGDFESNTKAFYTTLTLAR